MKKLLPNLMLALVFLAGLTLLLYPTVSNYINTIHQSHVVSSYEAEVAKHQAQDYTPIRDAAMEYNVALAANPNRFLQTDEEQIAYNAQLNPFNNGIMGYVEIDKIGVKLPIYHGTDDSVLQVGTGHVVGTSLPTGGAGTHCAISGHSGLPSAMLFTNLDQLVVGDEFSIHVLNETLTYRVDQILVVEPYDLTALEIDPAQDYCTLVTCTPYGINSHRLMVRGVRTQTDAPAETAEIAQTEVEQPETYAYAPAILTVLFLLILILLLLLWEKKTRRKKHTRSKY
ncbi:MAG: class C sortase [Eubacteriales bacterium]|nr:class C sortase [Eubacteriales bacterium]